MSASKRAFKELEDLRQEAPPYLRHLRSASPDGLVWHVLLLPEQPPYCLRAFRLRLDFPRDYPFRPPAVTFATRIYHPNVDEQGQVCLPLLSSQNWKPHTKASQVLEVLNHLVNRPNLEEPLRVDLADLLARSPEVFWKRAEEFTLQFGEDRPS